MPHLDGNPSVGDRPLFVQFCANDPSVLLAAAQHVAPHCDAVDLNLGCPQGIARKGRYGAFLQEEPDLIAELIRTLHEHLDVPVTAKIRVLATREATLEYARRIVDAGASILTVHGRRREMKGHLTGRADWGMIRFLRENLPRETVIFANGNILSREDVDRCLAETGADAVMSAEGNLANPAIFADIPAEDAEGSREYWRGRKGGASKGAERGGWRLDGIVRRYLDILYTHVLGNKPPERRPLFVPGDDMSWVHDVLKPAQQASEEEGPPKKRRKGNDQRSVSDAKQKDGKQKPARAKSKRPDDPNITAVRPHLFSLLRPLVSRHHDVRDALAHWHAGDMDELEHVLDLVEAHTAVALDEYARTDGASWEAEEAEMDRKLVEKYLPSTVASSTTTATATVAGGSQPQGKPAGVVAVDSDASSVETVRECRRPWWIAQAYVRPLPREALANGSITLGGAKNTHVHDTIAMDAGSRSGTRQDADADYAEREEEAEMASVKTAEQAVERSEPLTNTAMACG